MNPEFFRIAAAKTSDLVALQILNKLEHAAQELAIANASFTDRINANKAKRGEPPTPLSKAKKSQLADLAQEEVELDNQLCDEFRKMTDPSQIVWAVQYALNQDISNAKKLLKHFAPEDKHLGEEIIRLKCQLLEAATAFLETYALGED